LKKRSKSTKRSKLPPPAIPRRQWKMANHDEDADDDDAAVVHDGKTSCETIRKRKKSPTATASRKLMKTCRKLPKSVNQPKPLTTKPLSRDDDDADDAFAAAQTKQRHPDPPLNPPTRTIRKN
jgi:hypothetical protein